MRQTIRDKIRRQPLVGIAVDVVTGYGRAVMRGAMRHANIQRSWLIHEEMRRIYGTAAGWPDCDGAIVAGVGKAMFQQIRSRSKHLVHCSGAGDPTKNVVVCLDDHAVGRLAAEHLVECRLENFAFYKRSDSTLIDNRVAGFRDTLARLGKTCTVCNLSWPENPADVPRKYWEKLRQWLEELPKPIGIMCMDDTGAHDVAAVCLQADIRVPEEVAIVGVNNDELLCQTAWPPLSSVEGDFERVGYLAAQLLDRLLNGEKLPASDRLIRIAPLGVVRRQSTDTLAVDDPEIAEAVRFIRQHACDPCSVQDVLQEIPVARRWLERQFVKKLGRTPHEEIIRAQMETARRLLLQSGVPLATVANKCGFSSLASFARSFSHAHNTTPAAYRRSKRQVQSGT